MNINKPEVLFNKISEFKDYNKETKKKIKDEKYFLSQILINKNCKEYWILMEKCNRFLRLDNLKNLNISHLYKYLFGLKMKQWTSRNSCPMDFKNDVIYYNNLNSLKEENEYIHNLNLIKSLKSNKNTKHLTENKDLNFKVKWRRLSNLFKNKLKKLKKNN